MRTVKTLLLLLLVVLIFIFVNQNLEELARSVHFRLNLYVIDLSPGALPMYAVLLITFLLGLLISGVVGMIRRIRLKSQCKRLRRILDEKEKELNSLRNLPVLEGEQAGERKAASN
jgi:putative membrane protein